MGKEKIDIKFESLSAGITNFLKRREVIDQETLERFLDPSFERLRKEDEVLIKVVKK